MKKTTLIVIGVLAFLAVLKLYKINGGFVPAQPDERTYAEVVNNFHINFFPNYDGVALFNSPPFFHYLSFIISLITPGYYLPLRLVSLISSFLLSIVIFLYLRNKHSNLIAFGTVFIYSLLPITVYFSRLGLIESLLSLLAFLFIICLEKTWTEKDFRWAFFSGAVFGGGILTKYSILPLGVVPVVLLITLIVRRIYQQKSLKIITSKEIVTYFNLLLVIFAVAAVVFIPVMYFNYSLNPLEFKNQFKYIFGLGGRPLDLLVSSQYLTTLPALLSSFSVLLTILGVILSLKKANYYLFTLSTLFLVYALIRIGLYESRYVVILVPFLMVYLALGLDVFLKTFLKISRLFKPQLIFSLLVITILPASFLAMEGTYHTTIGEVGNYIKNQNKNNNWVVTNYWPSAFVNEVGYKTTWLTNDKSDAQAFSGLIGSKFIPPAKDTLSIILEEGGFVILESPFSKTISASQKRIAPISYIQNNYLPIKEFVDKNPQWPYFESKEKFTIYKIPKKN